MGKAFEKQAKPFEGQGRKQIDALKDLKLEGQTKSIEWIFSKDHESDEIKNEWHKIQRDENKVISDNLFYKSSNQICDLKYLKQ